MRTANYTELRKNLKENIDAIEVLFQASGPEGSPMNTD